MKSFEGEKKSGSKRKKVVPQGDLDSELKRQF